MSKITEARLEKMLVDWAKQEGGIALKGDTNFDTGYPDRIVYLIGAHAHVEVKGSSKRYHLNEKQKLWAGRILQAGLPFYVIESLEGLEHFKKSVYINPRPYTKNTYMLNGINLYVNISDISNTATVISNKNGNEVVILRLKVPAEKHEFTIYRVFKKLEEKYPSTNYEDM